MANSLQGQLQKSGLLTAKKAKQVTKDKRKQDKMQRKGQQPVEDNLKQQLAENKAEKRSKDKSLNQQQNQKSLRKALAAQIKQLIEINAIAASGDQPFNFTDGKHIKRIYVDDEQVGRLSRGVFTIVKSADRYVIVPTPVADKIAQRDPERIIFKAEKEDNTTDADDPYAEYKIPDDLMW
ncbi:MAG: DUF2058 domain-containing protein [Gammaproteobacteria bacterium]|nr:MAG: DUF2058 domain-containing protein [Gammaproteobacteria bacterium]RLA48017.1 MAG: DUF2058 domain-containing protein [Gammaproteobacteria bacterium]